MALVPYVGGAIAPVTGLSVAQHRRATQALKKAAEIHAKYNVPYMAGGKAAFMMAPLNEVRSGPRPPRVARRSAPAGASMSTAPVAVGTTVQTRAPTASGRTFRISHTALFGSVAGSTSFSVQIFRVNPGLPDIFPWLSGLSGSFDMYRLIRCQVRYVPVTGTDTEGAMYVAWDPDPEDPAPTSKSQLMSQSVSFTTPVWKPASLSIPSQGVKYIRRGEVVNTTRNTYDNGQLQVAVQGVTGLMGDLYVEYTVELSLPHVVANNASLYWRQAIRKSAGSVAKATPHGTLPPLSYGDPITDLSSITYPSSGIVRYPLRNLVSSDDGAGSRTYRAVARFAMTGTGLTAPTVTCSDSNATITGVALVANAGGTAANCSYTIVFTRVPQAGSYLNVDFTGVTTLTGLEAVLESTPDNVGGTLDT